MLSKITATTGGRLLRLTAWLAGLLVAAGPSGVPASASEGYVDGISDQSLPAWDGSFATSPFASFFAGTWSRAGSGQITLSRYVVQWNVMAQTGNGAHGTGDYRERFEAWLEDVRTMGLTPVVALTSYDGVYPASPGEYLPGLEAILDRAAQMGYPIPYVEPWNEPNNQGRETAAMAAAFANSAAGLCKVRRTCEIVAGDFEDRSDVAGYEQAYERALSFEPLIWGVHPYVSVQAHDDSSLLRLIAGLPSRGSPRQIWFTEIGALYCSRGQLRGEAHQASDAAYLQALLRDPAVSPAHAFYYGFLFGGHASPACTASGGQDSELYTSSDGARAAAGVLLRPPRSAQPPPASGSNAPPQGPPWPPWSTAATEMVEAISGSPVGS